MRQIFECFDMNEAKFHSVFCVLLELLYCQNQDPGKNSHYEGKIDRLCMSTLFCYSWNDFMFMNRHQHL